MVAVKKDKLNGDALGTGRRKSSVARVRVRSGSGKITINQRPIEDYFKNEQDRKAVLETLEAVGQKRRRRRDHSRQRWRVDRSVRRLPDGNRPSARRAERRTLLHTSRWWVLNARLPHERT